MTRSRVSVILSVLSSAGPVRPLLAYEQRGPVVQLLASGTTDPTWQAPPALLAAAIDQALIAAEEKVTPANAATAGTATTPHALVIHRDGPDFVGACQCGRPIGRTPQARSLDGLVGLWEQHATLADPDATWADALSSLATPAIGAP